MWRIICYTLSDAVLGYVLCSSGDKSQNIKGKDDQKKR